MRKRLLGGITCLLTAATVFAQESTTTTTRSVQYDTERDRTMVADRNDGRNWCGYHANELNFGFFGTGTVGNDTLENLSRDRVERDGELGLGASISYFFHRNIGIEAYGYSEDTDGHFVDNVGADLVFRFPLGESGVALYGFGGAARQFDPIIQWTYDAGGGVEWRFADHVGIFVDARYVWPDHTQEYGLGRLGLKFGF